MRVLLVMTARQIGGAEISARQLIAALGDRCDFTVVMSDHPAMEPLRAELAAMARVIPMPVDRLPALPAVAGDVRRLADEHDVTQLISNHPASRLGIAMGFILGGARSPLVVVEQRATPVSDVHVPAVWAPVLPSLFRWSRQGAARVVAVSQENRATLVNCYGLPASGIDVVYNGVDMALFDAAPVNDLRAELGLAAGQPVIVTVARLLPNKGHRYLIEAAPEIVRRFPDVHLILAGDGEERGALEAQIAALGLTERFSLLGFRPDVADVLRASDLFVLPSLAEGFALALVEALAAGLPVVATVVGGAAEVIADGRNGALVPPGDASALAAMAIRLLSLDPVARQEMAVCARATAESFSTRAMADNMLAIYQRAVHATGAP